MAGKGAGTEKHKGGPENSMETLPLLGESWLGKNLELRRLYQVQNLKTSKKTRGRERRGLRL